ncbi:hypothetical protein P7M42_25355, partial [Vibrio parahaemolyticus]|nr:hypothetical protein [Vibrio parahaemolyticus]
MKWMTDSSKKIVTKIRIISFQKRKGKWQFGIRIKCREKCMVKGITLKKRNGDKVYQISFQESNVNEFEKKVTFEINLNQIELGPFFWDFYVQLKSDDILTCYRIKHPNYMVN